MESTQEASARIARSLGDAALHFYFTADSDLDYHGFPVSTAVAAAAAAPRANLSRFAVATGPSLDVLQIAATTSSDWSGIRFSICYGRPLDPTFWPSRSGNGAEPPQIFSAIHATACETRGPRNVTAI